MPVIKERCCDCEFDSNELESLDSMLDRIYIIYNSRLKSPEWSDSQHKAFQEIMDEAERLRERLCEIETARGY